MNDINNGYDRHLDPPDDEIEQEYCEFCNQDMEYHEDRLDKKTVDIWWKCTNPFCPEKFEKYKGGTISVVLDMAEHLVELEQELSDTKLKLKPKQHALDVISRMTPSQSNVVVRDTEYAIKMVEDSIEYAYLDCGMSAEGRNTIWVNWAEVKKILASYG